MLPKLIEIGSFYLPTYGVLVAAAFLTALAIAGKLGREQGLSRDAIMNLGIYCALAGIVESSCSVTPWNAGSSSGAPGGGEPSGSICTARWP